jgi:hypothetical protein
MVNVTYGILIPQADGSYILDSMGTDIVSTLDGVTSVFDPGDIAWVLTCAALIIFMVGTWFTFPFAHCIPDSRPWLPLLWSRAS